MEDAYEIMRENIFRGLKEEIDAYIKVENKDNSLNVIINKKGEETFVFYSEKFFHLYVDYESYRFIIDRIIHLYKRHILSNYFYKYR